MSTTQPNTKPLPLPEGLNPDALDVLSELANLLTRLRTLPPGTSSSTGATPSQSQSQPQSQSHGAPAVSHATPTPTALLSSQQQASKKTGELTLKEIPVATDALKHRLQRARTLLKTALPDLDRTLAEQEAEITALEARIARQRDALAKLREMGASLAVGQGEGDGDKMEE
ncbi:RNA polymerase II transcription mediator complex subunit 9-domain-containing protein [Xylaria cf. heliscus]|nr:RNA polymerase II transcription mediator complex subunit 9-domain-containing protein [Xylaria cf. heliscus]